MALFDVFISASQQAGIFSMYLPFILTFAIIYGLLHKSQILGKGKPANALNAIIGFSVAFYVIAFTSAGVTIATFFSTFFTQTTALIVTVIALVLIVVAMEPLWPLNEKLGGRFLSLGKFVPIIVIAILLWSFSSSGGTTIFGITIPGAAGGGIFGLSSQDVIILVFILVTVGIIYFVTSEPKPTPTPTQGRGGEHSERG